MPLSPAQSAIIMHAKLTDAIAAREPLERIDMLYCCYVLACCGHNKSQAAKKLGVHRRTLHRWAGQCEAALNEP